MESDVPGLTAREDARSRRTFLSNVAHELRTPVAIIQGTTEQLQAGTIRTPAEKDRAVGLVHLEIRTLTRLIDDLSTLGRLEEAKLRLDLQPVDMQSLVQVIGLYCDRSRPLLQAIDAV